MTVAAPAGAGEGNGEPLVKIPEGERSRLASTRAQLRKHCLNSMATTEVIFQSSGLSN